MDSDKVLVRYFRRVGDGQWLMHELIGMDDVLDVVHLDMQLTLAQIYHAVELEA